MKVTMQDVADHAGVDKATVSRVLRGDSRISEKTRLRVAESVRALDYKIDRNARNLSTNRSGLAGVVLRDLNQPWTGAFLAGILRAFSNSDYEIVLRSTEGRRERARSCMRALEGRHAEGIIWADAENFPDDPDAPAASILCVGFTARGTYSVTPDKPGASPTFEMGVLVGRMMLNIVTGKPVPARDIIVKRA